MSFADTLSDRERKRARIYAYCSTYSGCISEVMLDSSAIIILFFTMLKASPMATMFSTSATSLLSLFLYIPCAFLSDKIGLKLSVKYSCIIACIGFCMIAAAPFCPASMAVNVAMAGTFIYCMQRSWYGAAWYPLLDNFLKSDERGKFFSVMRTSYMIFNGVFFFLLGLLLGKEPPFWLMQSVIAFAGFAMLLRWYCISKFPMPEEKESVSSMEFMKSLGISMRNAPLTGFSTYLLIFSIAHASLIPLTLLYLRNEIQLAPGTVQILSSVGMAGSITGHFLYRYISRKLKIKWIELLVHFSFILLPLSLFFLDRNFPFFTILIGIIIFLLYGFGAWWMSNNSMEYLALARPGNKTMAMAYCQTYLNIGGTISRVGSSLLLGVGILAPAWKIGEHSYTLYHTLFLFAVFFGTICLVLIPILPSFIPRHSDYYNSADKK